MVSLATYAKAHTKTQTVEAGRLLDVIKRPFQSQMQANHSDIHAAIRDHYDDKKAHFNPKMTTDYARGEAKSDNGFNEEHGVSVKPSNKSFTNNVPSAVHVKQHPETGEWHAVAENRSGDESLHGKGTGKTPYGATILAMRAHDKAHPNFMTGGAMYHKSVFNNMSPTEGMNAGYGYRSPNGFNDKK